MNTIKLNTLGDKVIVRKTADGGNEGGDTGGSGGGSNYVYIDWNAIKEIVGGQNIGVALGEVGGYSVTAKMEVQGNIGIFSMTQMAIQAIYSGESLDGLSRLIVALAIDLNLRVYSDGSMTTVGDIMRDNLSQLPQITEEEFYTL